MMKRRILVVIAAAAVMLAGSMAVAARPLQEVRRERVTLVERSEGPESSRIYKLRTEGGEEFEVREFESGPVRRVVRRNFDDDDDDELRVTYRDGRVVEVDEEGDNAIVNALTWTGDKIADAAQQVGDVLEGAVDRLEDLGDKAVGSVFDF